MLDVEDLNEPVFLPDQAMPVGTYHWRWTGGWPGQQKTGETFTFVIDEQAAVVQVPPVECWLARMPEAHPQLWVRPEQLATLRGAGNDRASRAQDIDPADREAVVQHLARRCQQSFQHTHDQGCYGVSRFDSHAGRQIVFLAIAALTFHDSMPEADQWLTWLRPVLCGIWPVWAGEDGAWAEGPTYGVWYVSAMCEFALALKHVSQVDLFARPFWANHARWLARVVPPYAQWVGFGDHTERWGQHWSAFANVIEIIMREVGSTELDEHLAQMRAQAMDMPTPPRRQMHGIAAHLLLRPRLCRGNGLAGSVQLSMSRARGKREVSGWVIASKAPVASVRLLRARLFTSWAGL